MLPSAIVRTSVLAGAGCPRRSTLRPPPSFVRSTRGRHPSSDPPSVTRFTCAGCARSLAARCGPRDTGRGGWPLLPDRADRFEASPALHLRPPHVAAVDSANRAVGIQPTQLAHPKASLEEHAQDGARAFVRERGRFARTRAGVE